jgi:hypothetical protein
MSVPGGTVASMRGYEIKKVYLIICEKCNEDITRPLSGEDVETRAEAERLAREHEQGWHTGSDSG